MLSLNGVMTLETKVRKIGNSYGVILSKEVLAQLKAEEGTTLCLTEAAGGGLNVRTAEPEFVDMMSIVDQGMKQYQNALKELAK